jgi:hypothetical protein
MTLTDITHARHCPQRSRDFDHEGDVDTLRAELLTDHAETKGRYDYLTHEGDVGLWQIWRVELPAATI